LILQIPHALLQNKTFNWKSTQIFKNKTIYTSFTI